MNQCTKLQVYGDDYDSSDGTCIRDYIHVNDLCDAHLSAMNRLLDGKVSGAEAYNLGNGQGFSVKEVIEVSRKVTGVPVEYRVVARRPGDPPQLVGSSQKAGEVLGWHPKHAGLDDIIKTAWQWVNRSNRTI